jgi:hypothetical protein
MRWNQMSLSKPVDPDSSVARIKSFYYSLSGLRISDKGDLRFPLFILENPLHRGCDGYLRDVYLFWALFQPTMAQII